VGHGPPLAEGRDGVEGLVLRPRPGHPVFQLPGEIDLPHSRGHPFQGRPEPLVGDPAGLPERLDLPGGLHPPGGFHRGAQGNPLHPRGARADLLQGGPEGPMPLEAHPAATQPPQHRPHRLPQGGEGIPPGHHLREEALLGGLKGVAGVGEKKMPPGRDQQIAVHPLIPLQIALVLRLQDQEGLHPRRLQPPVDRLGGLPSLLPGQGHRSHGSFLLPRLVCFFPAAPRAAVFPLPSDIRPRSRLPLPADTVGRGLRPDDRPPDAPGRPPAGGAPPPDIGPPPGGSARRNGSPGEDRWGSARPPPG